MLQSTILTLGNTPIPHGPWRYNQADQDTFQASLEGFSPVLFSPSSRVTRGSNKGFLRRILGQHVLAWLHENQMKSSTPDSSVSLKSTKEDGES